MFSSGARFLVVDDTNTARDFVRIALNKIGFNIVDEAANGKAALDKLKRAAEEKKSYSIVFLDLNMPEMGGLKCLEAIRADQLISEVPVVIITTESAKPTVIQAVMQGVSGYIVKPFTADDVQKKVAEIFHRLETEGAGTVR